MAEGWQQQAQSIPSNQGGEVVFRCRGLPTLFDQQRTQWQPMCNPKDLCFIELISPPNIVLRYMNGKLLGEIKLPPSMQYHQQSQDSFIFQSIHGMYGIRLINIQDALQFQRSLQSMHQEPTYNKSYDRQDQFFENSIVSPQHGVPQSYSSQQSRRYEAANPMSSPLHENPMSPTFRESTNHVPPSMREGMPSAMHQNFMSNSQLADEKHLKNNMVLEDRINDTLLKKTVECPTPSEIEVACDMLSEAIENGNVEKAKEIAARLAVDKAKVTVHILTLESGSVDSGQEFKVHIQVEDRNDSKVLMTHTVNPETTTVRMLKYMIQGKYGFPVSVQRWIINKRLAKDKETLSKLGVNTTGSVIFLYLKSMTEELKDNSKETQTDFNPLDLMPPNHYTSLAYPPGYQDAGYQDNYMHLNQFNQPMQFGLTTSPPYYNPNIQQQNDVRVKEPEVKKPGWKCPQCTFDNYPTFPGCTMCSTARPEDYQLPPNYKMEPEEEERLRKEKAYEELTLQEEFKRKAQQAENAQMNYLRTMEFIDQPLLPNPEPFDCPICYTNFAKGEAIMLRECLHCFCRDCLAETIKASEDLAVQCPHSEGFPCPAVLTGQEIESILPPLDFAKFLDRSLAAAEHGSENSFHCRTANCKSWCVYEDEVNFFDCPVCKKRNCLTCKAIHDNQTCKEYQDDLRIRAENDEAAKKTQEMLNGLVARGEAMNCPKCKIILQKKSGCDWMKCTMCRTEICWAIKGPRWGPGGVGDTSAGCKCNVNKKRCTPTCGNCH